MIDLPADTTLKTDKPTIKDKLTVDKLIVGNPYNFINQEERLIYKGRFEGWYQFYKVGDKKRTVWCEVLVTDMFLLEETTPSS